MGRQRRLPARQAGLIAALLLATAACGSDDTPALDGPIITTTTTTAPACSSVDPGESRVDVGDRWYLRHIPPAHDGSTPLPLVVDLHGYSEGAVLHASVTKWGAYGDTHDFVTVTPHTLGEPPAWDLAPDGVDVAFVDAVITDAEETLCIDAERIFVTGHSMGAFLISQLACSPVAARVAVFAPVAGARSIDPCDPPRHDPALIIHGTADGTVLYEGGLSEEAAQILGMPADGPSIPDIAAAWAARDPAVDVELHPVEGGSHEWPRSANDWIWEFFESVP